MALTFEEKYLGVLQNIEVAIVDFSRDHPDMLDYDVEGVLDALVAGYTAEARGRIVQERHLPGLRQPLLEEVRATCEWLLGRSSTVDAPPPSAPQTLDEIVACLNKIRKSVRRWTKEAGRRGYIGFVQRYVL